MSARKDAFAFSEAAHRVLRSIESSGREAWFVGGCVRDSIMGREVNDIDITTSAPWEEVAHLCADKGMAIHETGVRHGTVTVVCESPSTHRLEGFEVTTYRTDSSTSKDARHPDSVTFVSSIEEDLKRRDFTMNAIAWHPERGLIDPFEGQRDIALGIIRTLGDPHQRFREDALRILRACRFASQLGFAIDGRTYDAMLASKHLLTSVSTERTTHELDLMLMGPHVHDAIMDTVDVLAMVLPELVSMKGCAQATKYHVYDVLEHTAWAVQLSAQERLIRWAALCHDMGKPAAAFFDENGVEHFYGHAKISARLARGIADRLLMSNTLKSDLVHLVATHDNPLEQSPRAVRRALARCGGDVKLFRAQLALKRADALAHAPEYRHQAEAIDVLEAILDETIAAKDAFTTRQLAIDGNDILSLGVEAGPAIGNILQAALEEVIDERIPNERNALLEFARSQAREIRPNVRSAQASSARS